MLLQQGRNIFQHGIPAFMTVGIVNLFEKVNISDGERKRTAGGSGLLEDLAQFFVSAAAVVQLGQGILLDHGTKRALHGQGTATDIT